MREYKLKEKVSGEPLLPLRLNEVRIPIILSRGTYSFE